jgi:hypothetical protein
MCLPLRSRISRPRLIGAEHAVAISVSGAVARRESPERNTLPQRQSLADHGLCVQGYPRGFSARVLEWQLRLLPPTQRQNDRFGSKADLLWVTASRPLHPAKRTAAEPKSSLFNSGRSPASGRISQRTISGDCHLQFKLHRGDRGRRRSLGCCRLSQNDGCPRVAEQRSCGSVGPFRDRSIALRQHARTGV